MINGIPDRLTGPSSLSAMRLIHCFDNGIKVYDDHLIDAQRLRYAKCNVHEEDEENLFCRMVEGLPANGVFVSLGSAIGYYPLLAKRLRPDLKIHCFEPLERHRKFLMENVYLNNYSEDDFVVHALAVTPTSDEYLLVDRSFGSFLVAPPDVRSRSTVPVQTVSILDIGEVVGASLISLVQMDIQGFEALLLESYFSSKPTSPFAVAAFLIGTHGEGIHSRCRSALGANGYSFVHDEFETLNQPDGILAAVQN